MHQKKILTTALVASTIAGVGIVPAQSAEAASLSSFISNALAIANDDSHGYSMINRWGPDYDCSSFVITCLKQAGFDTGGATYSGNMVSNLTAHGFSYIPSSKIDLSTSASLQAGDILMASGHTEIYIGNGKRVGAHNNYDGKTGDSGGNEINVLNYTRGSWYGILRYTGSGSSASAVTTAAATTTASSSAQAGTYKVNANLNLRSGNSTGTSILTTIPKGTSVSVSQVSNGWGKTTYSGKTGWIYLTYATKTGSTAQTTTTASTAASAPAASTTTTAQVAGTVYKTNGMMYLRSANNKTSSILGVVPKGTSVTATQISNNWGKITYGGKTGWMSLKYSTKTGTVAASTASAGTTKTTGTSTAAAGSTAASQAAVSGTTTKTSSYVYQTTSNVNLRTGNSTSYAKLTVVPRGTAVTVTEIKDNWGKLSYGGKTGWISLQYASKKGANVVTTITTVANNTASSTSKSVSYSYTTTANLNLRKSYSTSSAKILTMPKGTNLTVTEIKNDWGKVSYQGNAGWMCLQYAICTGSQTTVKNVIGQTTTTPALKTASVPAATSTVKTASVAATAPTAKTASVAATTTTAKTTSVAATTPVMKTASVTASASAAKLMTSAAPVTLASTAESTAVTDAEKATESAEVVKTKPVSFSMPVSVVNAFEEEDKTAAEQETADKETAAEEVTVEADTAEEAAAEEVAAEEAVEAVSEETKTEEAAQADTEETEAEEANGEAAEEETEAETAETESTEAEAEDAGEEAVETEAEDAAVETMEEESEPEVFAAGNYAARQQIRVYADAYEGAEALASFDEGTVLEVTEASDGWGKVRIDGQTCWIRLSDVEKTDRSVTQDLKLALEETSEAAAEEETAAAEDANGDAPEDENTAADENSDSSEETAEAE